MNTGVVLTLQGQTGRPREGRSGPSAAVPASRFLSGVEVVLCPRAANTREQLCPGGTRMFAAADSRGSQGEVPVQQQPHWELARNACSQALLHLRSRNTGGGGQ